MDLARLFRHVAADFKVARAFPKSVLDAIEQAIGTQEKRHAGELRFAVEGGLPIEALWRGQDARERALEVFSQLRVWDTERNCGVLLYVLLGDRAVEVVADRGIEAKVGAPQWQALCRQMEAHFSRGDFGQGALTGIERAGELLMQHFPPSDEDRNELPDKPVVL